MLSAIDQAIQNTVAYADVFDFPLTLDELHTFLISPKPWSMSAVKKAAHAHTNISHKDGYYVLRGNTSIISARKKHTKFLKEKLRSARVAADALRWIPTISAIFVTGSVAANNATKDDDIDFLIITRSGWLWTTRLLVILISAYMGKYRTRSTTHVQNMWCFNMWLDESRLAVPPTARNLYTAHEVVQALPVFERHNVREAFLSENRWVLDVLANTSISDVTFGRRLGRSNMIERFCFAAQATYMRSAQTTEKVGLHHAFFHPRNTGKMILTAFAKRGGNI